jgi:hypothetical protein
MSRDVKVQFAVQSMAIMKNTLTQMGIEFNEVNADQVEVSRRYHNIVFRTNTETSCDDMDQKFVNSIAQNYTLNAYKDRAIREGVNLREERLANGQIVLTRI